MGKASFVPTGNRRPMDIATTLSGLIACVGMAVFSGWRGAQAPNPAKGPRLIPWRFLMVLTATVAVLFAAHALTLTGIKPAG